MPNPAGIGADDFFTKPVQVADLLEWIGRRLQLQWLGNTAAAGAVAAVAAAPAAAAAKPPRLAPGLPRFPPPAQLDPLSAMVKAGYMRGISRQLDDIAALGEPYQDFVDIMRAHALRFELEAMARLLEQGACHATAD
jgi:hypothetical protein